MEKKTFFKEISQILGVFILVASIANLAKQWLQSKGVDTFVLQSGNLILFLVAAVSFIFYRKGMAQKSTQGFLRNVYSAMLLKLFVCIIAAFAYIYAAGSNVNKPALFGCMFLYLVYTFIEMLSVMRFNKQQK